ncbi:hypothetical protein ACIKQB_08810, partial [Acinetobacter baumannii]
LGDVYKRQNLPNGSMGSFGVTGASVTDFKMKVSGF